MNLAKALAVFDRAAERSRARCRAWGIWLVAAKASHAATVRREACEAALRRGLEVLRRARETELEWEHLERVTERLYRATLDAEREAYREPADDKYFDATRSEP